MKKYIFIPALALLACNNTAENMAGKIETVAKKEAAATTKIDPVCEMPYDTAWVEMTIYKSDTIRFCSENCKKAFEARPEKYMTSVQKN